jgi:hypothetical protein
MKVGLSYSRCVRDIVEGTVDIDDVLVIIARTDFDPTDDIQWKSIWNGYHWSNPEWASYPDEDEDRFRQVSINLLQAGKLHQPRKFGGSPHRRGEYWLETFLPDSELENRPAVKAAWEQFQIVAGLSNTKLDKEYQ